MASTCSPIQSAIEDVELLLKRTPNFENRRFRVLRFKLKNLKTFVLGTRTLGSDAESEAASFVLNIEDTVRRNGEQIHPHCLSLSGLTTDLHKHLISQFEIDIESFKQEIHEWYLTMLEENARRSGGISHVLEIITSVFDTMIDYRSLIEFPDLIPDLQETIEAFEEQMLFIKSLISFVTETNVQELLAHAETVCVNASFLLFECQSCKEFQSKMSVLVLKIRPSDDACIRVLTSSKLTRLLLDDDDDDDAFVAMKDFIDSLVSNLWELLRQDICAKELQELYAGLRSFRAIVKKKPGIFSRKIRIDIGDLVSDAGILICSLHRSQRDVDLDLQNLLSTIKSIMMEIGGESLQVLMFSSPSQEVILPSIKEEHEVARIYSHISSQGATSMTNEVVGFDEEARLIVDQLTWGTKQLRVVAIVGMPGLGKTTLATKVFSNSSVLHHFTVRAWSSVSLVVDKKKVLLDLLKQIDLSKCYETDEQSLAEKLRHSLKGRRYIIILDDIWDVEAWDSLKASFPDDNVGSRIVLTSRRHDVAPQDVMVDRKPYSLHELSEENSMDLFWRRLSSKNGTLPPLSLDIRMIIAEKCRGLPLMIVIVAGILKSIDRDCWNEVLNGLSKVSSTEHLRDTLELSYKHLPPHLRKCLLYFGAFQEDQEVPVRRLVRLWIGEGFIQKDNMKSLEYAAERYLKDLIGRSLIMVAKQRSDGGVKACRIHDVLHEFCLQKAKDEHFFHFLKGYDELSAFSDLHNVQRLFIHSEAGHLKQSKLYCPRAHSLIFNSSPSTKSSYEGTGWIDISSAIHSFKLVRVLDIEQIDLAYSFPRALESLVHLAFLAIQCNVVKLPSWMGNLINLETFILQGGSMPTSLPNSFWNLKKLQYLYIRSFLTAYGIEGGSHLPEENRESSSTLSELIRLSGAVISCSKMESVLKNFPKLHKLKCILQCGLDERENLVVPNCLSQLESLNMLGPFTRFAQFVLPANLKKLTLENFSLYWRNISTIGELPNLEALKLSFIRFEGETWEMKEGEFSKLRVLKLVYLDELVRWRAESDDQLSCLQKLVLDYCPSLEEMPCCLETISTLEVIEVSRCPDTIVDLVNQIDERREELMGDSGLKIITSNIQNQVSTGNAVSYD